jgi:hypothetical protein
VCTPSLVVNSVSSVYPFSVSLLCSGREDSPIGVAGSIYVLVMKEAKTDGIPSPAKGLIRRGFFGPRVISPSTLVVKEAFVFSQSFKNDNSLGAVELCKVKEVESVSFLGSNSVSPSLPVFSSISGSKVDIAESLVSSTVSTSSHSLEAVELGKSLSQHFPRMSEGGAPFYFSVSKIQLGYSRRVKERVAKQLHKN